MIATKPYTDQELLAACVFPGADAQDLGKAFSEAAGVVARSGVPHAFAGDLGQARFCRARWTDIIRVRVGKCDDEAGLELALRSAVTSTLSTTSTIRLDLAFARSSTEHRFIERCQSVVCLGTSARMATVEHLLWLALSSNDFFVSQAVADAVNLIQSGSVDWNTFEATVEPPDPSIAGRLAYASRKARQTQHSSYPESVKRRLASQPSPRWPPIRRT